jgi:hypothetical protein
MLERHLRIGDALTEDALVEKTMMEKGVSMVRGDPPLKFTTVADPVNGTNRKRKQARLERCALALNGTTTLSITTCSVTTLSEPQHK